MIELEKTHVVNYEILAIIPARSGSKGIKNKNIKLLAGKPLLAHSIEHAIQACLVNRVLVSTDSSEYADIARKYGAEVPFLRPSVISGDDALDIDTFKHALDYLEKHEGYKPDIVVQLRPTYPIRDINDIDNMITLLINNPEIESIRCITPAAETPYKMWREENGRIFPLLNDIEEAYNMPRQKLPAIYMQNACIDVVRSCVIIKKHSMSGKNIMGYKMDNNFDIDTEDDFRKAEAYIRRKKDGGI